MYMINCYHVKIIKTSFLLSGCVYKYELVGGNDRRKETWDSGHWDNCFDSWDTEDWDNCGESFGKVFTLHIMLFAVTMTRGLFKCCHTFDNN